ncbi:MAG TPA: PDZ domain-containing protein [Streptosporangiaceae bacterium]|nr:PDZ domain-containing protein [Streptosporangiaceae bacterium]
MTVSRYLRYPHVRGDLLTFIADDDVWLAPADGGRAWRISADQSAAAYPRLSPDGSLIAWTSWRDGPAEIYLAATGEGGAARVTYWSSDTTTMHGWSPSGEILATTSADQPFLRQTWAHAIPVTDGVAQLSQQRRLPYGPVGDLAIDDGAVALLNGTGGNEPAFWKRYRGGRAGRLWVAEVAADGGQPTFRRLLADFTGQFFSPMLVAGRLAFISDHEGIGNIYSCALDGSDLRRHTDHDTMYARNASTDGTRVVYQLGGDIWMLSDLSAASEPARLDVSLGSPASGLSPRLVSADDHLKALCPDPTGRASAVEVRGTVHWLTHRDGPARALSAIPGPAARLPRVLGSTGQAVWVVDADGADALEIGSANGSAEPPRRIATGEIGWVAGLAAAPSGALVAVAARDGGLTVVDVASGAVTELTRSDNGPISGLAFAPDSRWLAWSQPAQGPLRKLRLARLADSEVFDITDGRFIDTDPAFTADGQYLAFLSKRTFDPIHDAHVFDLYFPFGSRPYLLTLAASTPSPFGPFAEGRPAGKDEDDSDGAKNGKTSHVKDHAHDDTAKAGSADDDTGDDHAPPVEIDLDGLGDRIVALPVPESIYASLTAVEGGIAWLREPLTGELGEGGANLDDDPPRSSLEHFDLKRVKCTELLDEIDWFMASGDGTRLVVRDNHRVFVIPANRKADSDNTDDRVTVDLSRARFLADPAALWRAAYAEAGRAMRHEFWVPDMADVDWDAVLAQYRPLLDRIATSDDFADVMHEVVGELGSSHAYIIAAGGNGYGGHLTGLLGADIEATAAGWRIGRILPGESSDPHARSPLTAPGVGVAAGDVIASVDGRPVDPASGPGPLLVGAAGKPVEVTVAKADGGKQHRAVVVPLADERRLRYQDWVSGRRRLVRELSAGRLGYLHVPDMQSRGWSDFHRDLRGELLNDGLIVDVRSNRGGHTSHLVVEKLARRIIGWDVARNAKPTSYPYEAPRGPVIAIADEQSASDGDIITGAIRSLGIGPVVGTRTWGGVIGIEGWHELVDGTRMTMPKFSFWFDRFGWGVENYGVDPDVEVFISPDDWAAGRDPQLETAVRLALEALAEKPAAQAPTTEQRPSRRRPQLPPRAAQIGEL